MDPELRNKECFMVKKKIYFADLTHTAQGLSSPSFPLGISYVVSYAKKELSNDFDFKLFKFPSDLDQALSEEMPAVLSLSNYSWNFQLAYKFAALAKSRNPKLVTIFGGPNFPTSKAEKLTFLQNKPALDFYIELEGELGFVDIMHKLTHHNFDVDALKASKAVALNTNYVFNNQLINGSCERIKDINQIPSPYLNGVLKPFFEDALIPMIETTRGCPFSCTFCADGLKMKNEIHRYDSDRTIEELTYIAIHIKNVDELIITDLNFGMYPQDVKTAHMIAKTQKKFNYPVLISASAGKNKPARIIEVAGILDGTWTLGASIQSTDPEVLKAINRSNISSEAYRKLIDCGNSFKNSKTHTEIILGLPSDTKEKHFECLRFGIENNANNVRMYQALLLVGTEMASRETREKFGLLTRFRVIPGCIGLYEVFGEVHSIAEIEEIIVGGKSMPFEDYIDCRVMNLMVETFHANAVFEEVFGMLKSIGVSPFECLLYVKEHPELYPSRIQEIIDGFIHETRDDLYQSFEEVQNYVLRLDIIKKYLEGELGTNELLVHRALLFQEFEDISNVLFTAVKEILRRRNFLNQKVEDYLDELKIFTILRKKNCLMDTETTMTSSFKYDFVTISKASYNINPNDLPVSETPNLLHFFHDEHQKQHIANQVEMYADTPSGLGRLIQRSNLKLMNRSFIKVTDHWSE